MPSVKARLNSKLRDAACDGDIKAVEDLLAHGASVDSRDRYCGSTALMWAVLEGHADIVRLLADRGATLEIKNNNGYTAVSLAATDPGRAEIARILTETQQRHQQSVLLEQQRLRDEICSPVLRHSIPVPKVLQFKPKAP